jgi:hypothetical protein
VQSGKFKRFCRYWATTFTQSLRTAKDLYAMTVFATMILAAIAWFSWSWDWHQSPGAQSVVKYASTIGSIVLFFICLLWMPFRRHEDQQSAHDLEKQELLERIQALEAEKSAREADVPRLEILFDEKNPEHCLNLAGTRKECQVAIRNASKSKAAEGVKLRVERVGSERRSLSYVIKPPSYRNIVEKLSPGESEFFCLFSWEQDSHVLLHATTSPNSNSNNNIVLQQCANSECELKLKATADNASFEPVTFRLSWNQAERKVRFEKLG